MLICNIKYQLYTYKHRTPKSDDGGVRNGIIFILINDENLNFATPEKYSLECKIRIESKNLNLLLLDLMFLKEIVMRHSHYIGMNII